MRIPVLVILLLGVISASSTEPNELVSFACRFFKGMFNGECVKVAECPVDQPIPNSDDTTIAGKFGESYPFTCKTGFTKLGSNGIIYCVSDGQGGLVGTWQIAISTLCEAVECPADQPITNSDDTAIAGTFGEGYPFTCKTGFTKLGSKGSISCVTDGQGGPDGKWKIDSTCEAVECPADQPITNSDDTTIAGTFSESYPFTCKTGFTKLGSTGSISCVTDGQGGPDGQWQIDSPCEAVECPADQPITNSNDATIAGSFGESYPFTCKTGFIKLGSNGSISCVTDGQGGPDGKWQIDSPCEAVECPADQPITNSNDTTIAGTFSESYPFTCKTGFIKLGSKGSISCVTDEQGGPDGQWQIDSTCEDCYNYTRNHYVRPPRTSEANLDQIECAERCSNDTQCSFALQKDNWCHVFEAPVIFSSDETEFDQCKAKCSQMKDCLLFNHWGEEKTCFIFNVTLNNLPYAIKDDENDSFGNKIYCI